MPAHGQPAGSPAELLVRRDRSIRYERGGRVYATDGVVGTLKQVVVDETAGEVTALVVALSAAPRVVLVPPDLVEKTAGTAVFLSISAAQFNARAPHAPQYDKRRFTKANAKALLAKANAATRRDPRRAVARVGRHFVETPTITLGDRAEPSGPVRAGAA